MAGNFDQDFAAALAGLAGSADFNPIPQAQPMQFQPPDRLQYRQPGPSPGYIPMANATVNPGGGGGNGYSWGGAGMDLLHGLMGVGNIITDTISSATDGNASTIPLLNWGGLAGQGQYNAWTDGKWTLGDIPGIGGLIGAGQNGKTTADIFSNFGLQEAPADPNKGWNPFEYRKGNFDVGDIASFIGDVALDPTTYVTFGGGSALKAGAKSAAEEAARQLATHGLDSAVMAGVKGAGNIAAHVGEHVGAQATEQAIAKGLGLELAGKAGADAATAARVAIENAGKTARATAQNALFSLDVPFTDITRQFGKKPGFLKVADSAIGEVGKAPVVRALEGLGLDAEKQKAFLKSAYGVEDASHMTSQMLEHFGENIGKVTKGEDLFHVFKPVTDELVHYHPADPLGILNSVPDPRVKGPVTPAINDIMGRGFWPREATPAILGNPRSFMTPPGYMIDHAGDMLGRTVDRIGSEVKNAYGAFTEPMGKGFTGLADAFKHMDNTAEVAFAPFEKATIGVENVDKTLKGAQDMFGLNQFAQDMGGSSPLGRYVGGKLSALDPRSLGSADPFINQGADNIRNAENFMRSNQGWTKHEIESIQKLAKGLSKEDLAKLPYILEGKAPGGKSLDEFVHGAQYAMRTPAQDQLMEVASRMKDMFKRQASRETGMGALNGTIDNYFPHVLNKEGMTKESLQALLADPEMSKLLGRSSANQFNQARKGFDSFAQWDDAIHSIETALKTETDPAKIEKLTQTLGQIQNLFERDPIKATANRMAKGIRSTSMTQLQGELRKMGTVRLPDDIAKDGAASLGKEFVRIDATQAGKLNLPVGTAIHKEVLQGLEKVPNLFTDAGVNQFVENMTSATNIWKNLVTTYVPSHHITNLMGNVANTTLAGVKPSSYKTAGELLSKIKKGTLSEAERKFVQEAVDKGVLGGGQLLDLIDPLRFAQQGGKIQQVERAIVNTKYAKALRGVGDKFEDISRLATYIHGKQVTGSAKLASDMVRKYLFNFGELTAADKAIKIVAPFWTWTKNNLPMQIGEFLRQPRYMATLKKLQTSMNDGNTMTPDYIQKSYFHIPGTSNSFFNPRIPAQDAFNAMDDPLGTMIGLLNPAAKVPIELKMNKQMFNGAPIDPQYTDRLGYTPGAVPSYLFKQTGVGSKAANFFDPNANILENIMGMLIGKPVTVDPAKEARNQHYQRQQDKQALKARAKKAGG